MPKQLKKPIQTSYEKVKKFSSPVSASKKVEMILAFVKTGKELNGNSVYNGHPVGVWAIDIRSNINRNMPVALTADELKMLKDAGILKRQFESTINEKIQALIAWNAKYPMAKVYDTYSDITDILKSYSHSDEEYQALSARYEKMQKYYTYVRDRRVRRKLYS